MQDSQLNAISINGKPKGAHYVCYTEGIDNFYNAQKYAASFKKKNRWPASMFTFN